MMDKLYIQEPYKTHICHHIHCTRPCINIFLLQELNSNARLCHKFYIRGHYQVSIDHRNVLHRMVNKFYFKCFSMWMVYINMKDHLRLVVEILLDMLSILIHLQNRLSNQEFSHCIVSKLYHWAKIKRYICTRHQQEFN